MPTQNEYNLSKQSVRLNSVRVNLLNYQFRNVGTLTGNVVDFPTFNVDANSDIRRTCSIALTPTDSSFDIERGNKIWLDKYMQIDIGQENMRTHDIEYTNMGIYLINNPQHVYSSTENKLTLSGIDLMAKLTGLRNGNLQGLNYIIPQGANVRLAIIATLDMCGFTQYVVEECPFDVPNDINIDIGGTAYDILSQLRDIAPNYQIYFDVDGVFHYEPIPSGRDETIMVNDDVWRVNLLDYQKTTNFESLKNSIEVIGKTHDISNYGGTATLSGHTYSVSLSTLSSLDNNTKIGFVSSANVSGAKNLSVTLSNTTVTYPILNEDGTTPTFNNESTYYVVKYIEGADVWDFDNVQSEYSAVATINNGIYHITDASVVSLTNNMTYTFKTPMTGCENIYLPSIQFNSLAVVPLSNTVKLRNDTTYTIKFKKHSTDTTLRYFQFMGTLTPSGSAQDDNPESPFYINGTVGEIRIVLSGGDYDNIYTSELAQQRAEWELYTRCKLQDNVTINCVPIWWLDVNWLVEITLPNKYGTETTETYIIKSISINNTQSVTMMKYYPYYED